MTVLLPGQIPEHLQRIPGSEVVIDWFGGWPAFHDANIESVVLSTNNSVVVKLFTFLQTKDLLPCGHYRVEKHAIVTLTARGVVDLTFSSDVMSMGIIFGLSIGFEHSLYDVQFDSCAGLFGSFKAGSLSIAIEPAAPR